MNKKKLNSVKTMTRLTPEEHKELKSLSERLEKSGVERTIGLRDAMGNDCKYYRKSLNMFLEKDYLELRDKIAKCNQLFNQIEE